MEVGTWGCLSVAASSCMVLWQWCSSSLGRTLSSYPSGVKVAPQEQGGSLPSLLVSWPVGVTSRVNCPGTLATRLLLGHLP